MDTQMDERGKQIAIQMLTVQEWYFSLVFLMGLYSGHRLVMVKEVGEIEEKIVVRERILEVRRMINVSAVEGMRQIVNGPFLVARQFSFINRSSEVQS